MPQAKPGDEMRYMSPRCASMMDALRTANTRGVAWANQREAQQNFNTQCGEEHADAMRQLEQVRNQQRGQLQQEQQAQNNQRLMSQAEQQQRLTQCAELRKSLAARKARPNLTDGERADIVLFEDRYNSRCH